MKKVLRQLQDFGLTHNEASVYLAALTLSSDSVQAIAKQAKINRVTAHGIIDALIERGYLKIEQSGKRRQIVAYSPVKLYDIVTRREDEVKNQVRMLETLVPELKKKHKQNKPNKTNLVYYEGEEGLKNWATDALETEGELLEWTKIESFTSRFSDYLKRFYFPEKFKRQIPTRFIFLDTPEARKYVQENYVDNKQAPPMKARFIPKEQFETPGFIAIYNNKFTIAVPKEMRAVSVEDELIADAQRRIWEFGWLHATDEVQNKSYPLD